MPNPNPRLANLTNAGKGRPKLDRDRILISIEPALLDELDRYCTDNKIKRPDAIEMALRRWLEINKR